MNKVSIVPVAMVITASHALASVRGERIAVPDDFSISTELNDRIDAAMAKKAAQQSIDDVFGILAESLVFQGKNSIERFNLAANSWGQQDSTDISGYSASMCYSNCFWACHGSRGWR